jgi:hypothetical protein
MRALVGTRSTGATPPVPRASAPVLRACAARSGPDEREDGRPAEGRFEAGPGSAAAFADLPVFPPARFEEAIQPEDEPDEPKAGEATDVTDDEAEADDEQGRGREERAPAAGPGAPSHRPAGRPLPADVGRRMGDAFGVSFGDVRIHEGRQAPAVGALAYAQGRDIHFAPGRYSPFDARGIRLLAHELVHVVQQRNAGANATRGFGVLDDPGLEAEAETLGAAAAAGEPVRVRGAAVGGMLRAADEGAGPIQRVDITWNPANERVRRTNSSSTTIEQPFRATFAAVPDPATNSWRLDVPSITGGVNIVIHTGGSRNAFDRPPTTEAQARGAVAVMRGYYNRGSRGSWHTEDASRAHENYHYDEWQCAAEHYWTAAEAAIRALSVPLAGQPDAAAAETALRRGTPTRRGADAIVRRLRHVTRRYWFTLADNARSRPYAAGQRELNSAIRWVQILALLNGWNSVDQRDPPEPSTANPCYRPHLRYTP